MPARLGVDIGGTFTDLVVIDEATGTARVGKVLTTPKDPAHGVEEGIRALLDDAGVRPDEVRAVVHGTTLATKLAELAQDGVEALAICLLHAYVNPAHEARLVALAHEAIPGVFVSCSSEVVPEIREYERASTTCANVYVAPLMARYLEDLERRLAGLGIPGQLYIMQSSGGIAVPPLARRLPVRLIESGPAAGALAAAQAAGQRREPKLLSFDMGGTTAKACVIDDGVPLVGREFEVARADRFKKGSGLPIRVPVIELIEIGAGGGSIARVDRMGLLKVGPDSAGADPGPACYNLGGRFPTVTDADLLLGYLDAEFFLGGRMRLDREAARRSVEEHVARPLGLDVTGAAWGIHRLVNENMAAAARIHGIERGRDLRQYPLFAFGGAGPVHCWQVAKILKVPRILIPFGAGAMSAYGLLAAPLAFDFVRTGQERLDRADWPAINRRFAEMEEEGRALLARAGVAPTDVGLARIAEMRYAGQGHEVECRVPLGALSTESLPAITASFESAYRALYHRLPQGVPIEALNWRLTVSGPKPTSEPTGRPEPGRDVGAGSARPARAEGGLTQARSGSARGANPLKATRMAYFAEAGGFVETPVYDRYALRPGAGFTGPAIVEERESTAVVGPGGRCRVDDGLALIVGMPS